LIVGGFMSNRIIHILTFAVLLMLFSVQLLNADVFSKRVTRTFNHRIMPDQINTLDIENIFTYTQTEPHLIESIVSTTTQSTSTGPIISTVSSHFNSYCLASTELTTVHYDEYRDNNPTLYATYDFVFNQDDDMIKVEYEVISGDFLTAYFTYRSPHQPDSIYIDIPAYTSYYKLCYDENDRLTNSTWYLGYGGPFIKFRGWFLSYPAEPYHNPNPLDFNNYRFYTLTWGGFESSCPIFDKNYVPTSISYQEWDDWDEYWYPVPYGSYGEQVFNNQIALINTQYGSYSAYFYFNDAGTYTHKYVSYNDGGSVKYSIDWEYDTPDRVESVSPPVLSLNPNPFRYNLSIRIGDNKKLADISIYNLKGQLIRSWKDVKAEALTWDGKDSANNNVSSGIYIIKARQGKQLSTLKVIKN
jgi:hypothetical protein